MKKYLLSMMAALVVVCGSMSAAFAHGGDDAKQVVEKSVAAMLGDLKKNKALYKKKPDALQKLINEKMLPYFDERAMAIKVLGQNWRSATKQQQNDFINEFEQLAMRTYSTSLLDYADATVEYGDASLIANGRIALVDVVVKNTDGKSYPLMLTLLHKKTQWKIIDVSMDGLSVVTIYQSALAEEIAKKGLQGIIDEYKSMNARGEMMKK